MATLGNQCKYAYYKGAAVLALLDGEVNGIDDSTNKAATWWAHVQAHDWLQHLFCCKSVAAKLALKWSDMHCS